MSVGMLHRPKWFVVKVIKLKALALSREPGLSRS